MRRQTRRSPCLTLKTTARALVLAEVRGEDLDRYVAIEQFVVRLPYGSHSTAGQMTNDAIAIG
jgi:hypothetical protein